LFEHFLEQRDALNMIGRIEWALYTTLCRDLREAQLAAIETDSLEFARQLAPWFFAGTKERKFQARRAGVNGKDKAVGHWYPQ
jgi:hypothetical protein